MKEQDNFFDNLQGVMDKEELEAYKRMQEAKSKKIDYLVHKVFAQSEDGKELLKVWERSLVINPTAEEGMDRVSIGIREGMKRFVRNIILTVERVANG
jgi:hypothetical protein